MPDYRLLVNCPDRPGLVAEITGALFAHGADISDLDEHAEYGAGRFAMRIVFSVAQPRMDALSQALDAIHLGEHSSLQLKPAEHIPRVAILCSKEDHCLEDLLWRFSSYDLAGQVVGVWSNQPHCQATAGRFAVPFWQQQVVAREQMPAHEQWLLGGLAEAEVDLVILARYMRILSGNFIERAGVPIINIHHSFLPAFIGADPYEQAHGRGVKLIGATAHYIVEELDAGPIIEQDVVRVSHRQSPADLKQIGRDVERVVLARAVRAHLEDRVAVWGNRAVVF